MMKNSSKLLFLTLLLLQASAFAQKQGFTIKSKISGMKDGLSVELLKEEGKSFTQLDSTIVKDGEFVLKGKVAHPMLCALITNNLSLLPADNQDMKKVRWTYTTVFVSNTNMTFDAVHYDSIDTQKPIGKYFKVSGGTPQYDLNEYNLIVQEVQGKAEYIDPVTERQLQMNFIKVHPHSVLSVYFANKMLLQANPRLSKKEIIELNKMITTVPYDEIRLVEFRKNSIEAERTAVNEKLQNLPLIDDKGTSFNLTDVVPRGKYVLIDFWASWCSICRAQIPGIKKLVEKYSDKLIVVSVSDDRDKKAWLGAVAKEKMPWKQYQLTPQGSKDLMKKYLVQGVPYYLLINPKGLVIAAPTNVQEMEDLLMKL
jgi:Thioredoxin domain-containing protein